MSCCWLKEIGLDNVAHVGSKNASLGEMLRNLTPMGIQIPNGFVITTSCYQKFIKKNKLKSYIDEHLRKINPDNLISLRRNGLKIRTAIENAPWPEKIAKEILKYYSLLSQQFYDSDHKIQQYTDVAVRSSSTSEDLPYASFAGQQETFLNVRGNSDLLNSIKACFASLFTDRAISYRYRTGYSVEKTLISVCVQKMVRSDLASAGVAFSIDTESGFRDVVLVNGAWGLGEMVVGGTIKPDEFIIYKKTLALIDKKLGLKDRKMIYGSNPSEKTKIVPTDQAAETSFCLTDIQLTQLSGWVVKVENYYSNYYKRWTPVNIEWAVDGLSGKLFLVQARPETVISKEHKNKLVEYKLITPLPESLLSGIAVGDKVATGKVRIIHSLDQRAGYLEFNDGDILVTDLTTPDWEPLMKRSSAIITNKGGRVCHSAIVARELGIPAVVGSEKATVILLNGVTVTVSCCQGETGYIYSGELEYGVEETNLNKIPTPKTKLMINLASPEKAFTIGQLPHCGVGLARVEFIISNWIGVHPKLLLDYDYNCLHDAELKRIIADKIVGYKTGEEFYINKLAFGIARIAASFHPHPVIVRFSDFKSNEYKILLGGERYEPDEENPMIGFRGASRYYSDQFVDCFGMECEAIKKVRNDMGLNNVVVMIPFCRTVSECKQVLNTMASFGLKRGVNNLKVYLMCEVPSNVILVDQFAQYIDGYSIGSNDLTQLTLGLDRDSELVADLFDERNDAVTSLIKEAIKGAKRNGIKIGICGQASSDFPEFTQFLIKEEIDTISVTSDVFVKTVCMVNNLETSMEKLK